MTADLIFFNGRVFTADPRVPSATAAALAGDRVVAVGQDADALALRDRSTEVVNLEGRMLARLASSMPMSIPPVAVWTS